MADNLLCGVDLGGTKLIAGLVSESGEVQTSIKVNDHVQLGNHAMVERIASLVGQLLKETGVGVEQLRGVGVGMAAHTNARKGLVITTSNLPIPFRNYPLRDELQQLLGVNVVLDNDASAQAYGEYLFGAGQGCRELVFMTVSTGVGAGIISQGNIFRGFSGFAGEIGHTIVEPSSRVRCTCGNYGCLMALCGTLGLPSRYRFCMEEGMGAKLDPDEVDNLDGVLLEKGVDMGDEIALRLFQESADYIGIGIYNIYQAINPQRVILGGGMMRMKYGFMNLIQRKFDSLVQNMVDERMDIVPAKLGDRAGLLGASALLLESDNG